MKKLTLMISAIMIMSLMFTACDKIKDKAVINDNADISNGGEAETQKPTLAERDRTADSDSEFIHDDAGILSSAEFAELNEYTAWLSGTFKINVSVVTVSDIGEKTEEEYATDYYNELYGSSNGIMFLVNNDSGNDYLLRKGSPSLFISDSGIEMLFSEISPLLVTENYSDAIHKALEYIELSMPEFAVDRTNKLSREDILETNDILSSACSNGENLSMIFIGDIGEKKIEDYAREQSEKYFEDGSDSALMTVNTENGEYYICAQGSFKSLEDNSGDIKDSVAECLTETEEEKSFDFKKSAEIFVKFAVK